MPQVVLTRSGEGGSEGHPHQNRQGQLLPRSQVALAESGEGNIEGIAYARSGKGPAVALTGPGLWSVTSDRRSAISQEENKEEAEETKIIFHF